MGQATVCDATGRVLRGDSETFKELSERTYGPPAARAVRAYLAARDALQERLAHEYAWGLLKLREDFRAQYPEGKLPDEF